MNGRIWVGGDAISLKRFFLNQATKIRRDFDGRLLIGLWPRKNKKQKR